VRSDVLMLEILNELICVFALTVTDVGPAAPPGPLIVNGTGFCEKKSWHGLCQDDQKYYSGQDQSLVKCLNVCKVFLQDGSTGTHWLNYVANDGPFA